MHHNLKFLNFLIFLIDRLSGLTALIGACLVLPIAAVMFYEVVMRFFFDLPTFWAYELAYMMTGAHFSLGIAYVLREGQHVRIDFLYMRLNVIAQTLINLTVFVLFLFPIIGWMTILLWQNAFNALSMGEVSGESTWNPYIWPIYSITAFGFTAFTLQIISEVAKCLILLITRKLNA